MFSEFVEGSEKFVWGWLRLILGMAQMTLAMTTAGLFLLVGFRPVTWIFLAIVTLLTIASRLLCHGDRGSNKIK